MASDLPRAPWWSYCKITSMGQPVLQDGSALSKVKNAPEWTTGQKTLLKKFVPVDPDDYGISWVDLDDQEREAVIAAVRYDRWVEAVDIAARTAHSDEGGELVRQHDRLRTLATRHDNLTEALREFDVVYQTLCPPIVAPDEVRIWTDRFTIPSRDVWERHLMALADCMEGDASKYIDSGQIVLLKYISRDGTPAKKGDRVRIEGGTCFLNPAGLKNGGILESSEPGMYCSVVWL